MKRLAIVFKMLLNALARMRKGRAPFTNREMVAGFSQVERTRFPELERFPDAESAENAWQQAADEMGGLWATFGAITVSLLVAWRFLRVPLLTQLSYLIVLGWFASLCLDILVGGIIGVLSIVLTMRIRHRSVRRSLRRQLIALSEPTCLACGYDLTGNESGRCPECGFSTASG
ncbi:MAG: hypothetical protein DHS20C16_32680 [Phycisphaerae bacterium]|nr:MAG: hypothetical protein DHS20C16_32680 [Phycisphaerae bacterium]